NMIGVKEASQESLVGQAGEIEPVYDEYAMSFFVFDPATRRLYLPQFPDTDGVPVPLRQRLDNGYLPVVITTCQSALGVEIEEKAFATTTRPDQRTAVLVRFKVRLNQAAPVSLWFGLYVSPACPPDFRRQHRH